MKGKKLVVLAGLLFVTLAHASDEVSSSDSWFEAVGLSGLFTALSPSSVVNLPSATDALTSSGYTAACKKKVLEKLGWQITVNPASDRATINGGNPCDNTDLAESVSQGELRLVLPGRGGVGDDQLSAIYDDALSSRATVCLFKMKASLGVQMATYKLGQNKNYEFRTGSPFVYLDSSEWQRPCENNRGSYQCYQAASSGARALEVFAAEKAGTDCQAGLQVAELSTLRETLGDSEFDRLIAPSEVALGPWSVVNESRNIIWAGARNLEKILDRDAEELPAQGIHALQAVSGYIGNAYGEDYLDHSIDRGENFITVSVTHSAAMQLVRVGGFKYYSKKNEEIYRIARGISDKEAIKFAADDYDLDQTRVSESDRVLLKELQKLFRDPVYRGYRVFVHPLKVMTLGQHIARLLERNPRTPYEFNLYPTRYNGGLATIYLKSMLDRCNQP